VFPEHAPEVVGRARQRTLRRDVGAPVPIALSQSSQQALYITSSDVPVAEKQQSGQWSFVV